MGVFDLNSPTEVNDDVRTPEIGGISHSDWDPAGEDWGRGRRMGAPDRHLGGVSHVIIPVVASGLLGREWPIILMRRECTGCRIGGAARSDTGRCDCWHGSDVAGIID